jgi:hypothetical protein
LGDSELSSDLRWLDARLESCANSIQLSWSQRYGRRFDLLPTTCIRSVDLPTASFLLGMNRIDQSIEFFIPKLTDSLLQIGWQAVRKALSCRFGGSYPGQWA